MSDKSSPALDPELLQHPQPRRATPKAIIFDIGNVIVRINPARALSYANVSAHANGASKSAHDKSTHAQPEEMWRAIEADPKWPVWQTGRLTPTEWHAHVTSLLGISLDFPNFCTAWNRALDPAIMLPAEWFEQLGAQCRLALLSNTDVIHAECLENDFAFVRRFPVRIYSCAIGMRKPSATIFQRTLTALCALPSETLYIDDIPEFVAAAEALGMDGICFKTQAQLASDLKQRGLLVESSLWPDRGVIPA